MGSRVVGGAATGAAAVFSVVNVATAEPGHRVEAAAIEVGAWAGAAAGASAGAKIGALVGSTVGPEGTAIGAAVGAMVGGAGGAVVGGKAVEKAIQTPLPPDRNRSIPCHCEH